MIDSDGIATGAAISWGYDWRFGPVAVILRAWIGAEAGDRLGAARSSRAA